MDGGVAQRSVWGYVGAVSTGRESEPTPLVDTFGRRVADLRISVTDRCNFRCTYCMPAEGMTWLPREDLLTFEEKIGRAHV